MQICACVPLSDAEERATQSVRVMCMPSSLGGRWVFKMIRIDTRACHLRMLGASWEMLRVAFLAWRRRIWLRLTWRWYFREDIDALSSDAEEKDQ